MLKSRIPSRDTAASCHCRCLNPCRLVWQHLPLCLLHFHLQVCIGVGPFQGMVNKGRNKGFSTASTNTSQCSGTDPAVLVSAVMPSARRAQHLRKCCLHSLARVHCAGSAAGSRVQRLAAPEGVGSRDRGHEGGPALRSIFAPAAGAREVRTLLDQQRRRNLSQSPCTVVQAQLSITCHVSDMLCFNMLWLLPSAFSRVC